jgi:AraC-like DNA-binding protein
VIGERALDVRFAQEGSLVASSLQRIGDQRGASRRPGSARSDFIDLFRSQVGLSANLFHRIVRFQRVLNKVNARSTPDWGQLAVDFGYFDQSHLLRDFLAYSGFSPADYLERVRELEMQHLRMKFNHMPLSKQV